MLANRSAIVLVGSVVSVRIPPRAGSAQSWDDPNSMATNRLTSARMGIEVAPTGGRLDTFPVAHEVCLWGSSALYTSKKWPISDTRCAADVGEVVHVGVALVARRARRGSWRRGRPRRASRTPRSAGPARAPRESRLVEQDQGVERVAVLGEGVGDEPVVGRVARGGEEVPVEPHRTGVVVDLVLVAGPLRDLDDHLDLAVGVILELSRVPRISLRAGRRGRAGRDPGGTRRACRRIISAKVRPSPSSGTNTGS
jgi:hypothetical protein